MFLRSLALREPEDAGAGGCASARDRIKRMDGTNLRDFDSLRTKDLE